MIINDFYVKKIQITRLSKIFSVVGLKMKCEYPIKYYGDLCEYQNERISLTLVLVRAEKRDVYVIILMLFDKNNEDELIDF